MRTKWEKIVVELLTPAQVSEMLNVSPRTLESWRYKKRGPKYIKLTVRGSAIRYKKEDVEEYLDKIYEGIL